MTMKTLAAGVVGLGFLAAFGCRADVETTDDSIKAEVETPKIEVGDAPVDLDPTTDDDVDVDTPTPGDR